MDFFRKKKTEDKDAKQSLSPKSHSLEGQVIVKSPAISRLEVKDPQVLSPLSPSSVYSSGPRSPLEPGMRPLHPNVSKGRAELVGSSSPKLGRRMATPMSSPTPVRPDLKSKVSETNPNIVAGETILAITGNLVQVFSQGKPDVTEDSVTLNILSCKNEDAEGENYIMQLSGAQFSRFEKLQPRKTVLQEQPHQFIFVTMDEGTFLQLTLNKDTKSKDVEKLEKLLSESCHLDKRKWKQETQNRKAVALEAYEAGDLRFEIGDEISIVDEDESGYLFGEFNGNKGKFPSHLVRLKSQSLDVVYRGENTVVNVTPAAGVSTTPEKIEFSKNGSWMQSWVQTKNLTVGTWADLYMQAKTPAILTYQSSKLPDTVVMYTDIWTISYPLPKEDEDHPWSFGLSCKDVRHVFSVESEDQALRWVNAIEFLKKMYTQ